MVIGITREVAEVGPVVAVHGDDEIVNKIAGDFAAKAVTLDASRIRLEVERCTAQARKAFSAS